MNILDNPQVVEVLIGVIVAGGGLLIAWFSNKKSRLMTNEARAMDGDVLETAIINGITLARAAALADPAVHAKDRSDILDKTVQAYVVNHAIEYAKSHAAGRIKALGIKPASPEGALLLREKVEARLARVILDVVEQRR